MLADFEAAHRYQGQLRGLARIELNQKLTTEFTAGGSDIDVFMQRPLQEARVMQMNGWYEDLANCVADPEYDFADFADGAVGTTTVNGVLTGIPIVTEQEVLYHRKDLLEAAGLAVPTTLDELKAAAGSADRQGQRDVRLRRGQRSPLVTQFSSFLYSSGGDWFDETAGRRSTRRKRWPPSTCTARCCVSIPAGVLNMSWPQAGDLRPGQCRHVHRRQLHLRQRTRPDALRGCRQDRRGRLPGRPGWLDHVQRDELGPGHAFHVQEQGSRLRVHQVGDEQGCRDEDPG